MNSIPFDLNLLRVFDAMMLERNVTRAAQRLHLSQPAASHALERLRKGIGDPLFVRSGREMVPTAKATALEATVRLMLEQLGMVLEQKPFDPLTSDATIRIGCVDVVEYLMAPLFIAMLGKEAPNVKVAINSLDATNFQQQLAAGKLDFVASVMVPLAPGLHSRKLTEQSLVALVRKRHPLAAKERVTAQDLQRWPRLVTSVQSDSNEGMYDHLLAKAGLAGKAAFTTPHFFAAPNLLANTDLVMIVGGHTARLLSSKFPLTTLQLPPGLPRLMAYIIWHERTHRDPAQKWIRDRLVESARYLD
ncbi:MAG TPA: LysR family transcriptional regulator [Candidatus Acidoferrum sp.]|nr:LysR family transcriptional regulator [Candidatus Acidoferrum sp.]